MANAQATATAGYVSQPDNHVWLLLDGAWRGMKMEPEYSSQILMALIHSDKMKIDADFDDSRNDSFYTYRVSTR